MEITYESIKNWFENYFDDICKYQGNLDTVPRLKIFFTPDLKLTMYTPPSPQPKKTMTRDELLISFIHPGLQEDLIPHYYSIDVNQLIVVVQFEIRFKDKPSGKTWEPLQASAHYHLTVEDNKDLKIRKIHYWTEPLPGDLFEYWSRHRDEALRDCAMEYINSNR